MSRPSKSLVMARSAKAAMLAAVEIYNKTAFEFREEAFCVLIINAWEVLLKARIVSQNRNRLEIIYVREKGRQYKRSKYTKSPLTISLEGALNRTNIPANVRNNIETLYGLRNEITHLGPLHMDLKQKILEFGTASVENFISLFKQWFREPIDGLYLLPVGFIGGMSAVPTNPSQRQRQLLHELQRIAAASDNDEDGYAVALSVKVEIARTTGGGGTIGITSDPGAPSVIITDDEFLSVYPLTFNEVVAICKGRYQKFKQNSEFYDLLKHAKSDASCARERHLHPYRTKSPSQFFYNEDSICQFFDKHYEMRCASTE